MKLKTKIAGSLALPLALAVAANSAQAFTVIDDADKKVTIGGYLSAITSWVDSDVAGTTNNEFSAGNSRLNFGYTDKETGTRFFYEQQFVGGATHGNGTGVVQSNGLRHAFFETGDGLIGGYTWSFGTNLVALADTIDTTGNGNTSYQVGTPRTLLLGQRFAIADGQKVGVSLEAQNNGVAGMSAGQNTTDESVPAVTLNYEGNFADTKVFAAFTNYGVTASDKRANRVTFGADIGLDAANIKLGLTHNALPSAARGVVGLDTNGDVTNVLQSTHASAALGVKLNEKARVNLAVEHSMYDKKNFGAGADNVDSTNIWLNAFYQADNGVEWGGELQYVTGDTGVTFGSLNGRLDDKDLVVRLQAKYAF